MKSIKFTYQTGLIIALIALGVISRLLPHPANFAPITAIALFAGAKLGQKYGIVMAFVMMVISDLLIGLHDVIFFTWGSFILIALLGSLMKKTTIFKLTSFSLISSLLFFLITNFGVWLVGKWYPTTISGLMECYVMGLPFIKNTILGDLFYTGMIFGLYEVGIYLGNKLFVKAPKTI